MAEDVAESISGVKDVHNQLRVSQGQQGSQSYGGQQSGQGQSMGQQSTQQRAVGTTENRT
jgi:hypothetical protein